MLSAWMLVGVLPAVSQSDEAPADSLTADSLTTAPETASETTRLPIQATDLFKIRQIEDVNLSPDGREVAFTVRRVVERSADEAEYRTQLYVVPTNGRDAPRLLTRGDAFTPAWHPNSDRLAFVRPVDGTPQVFILPLTGGEPYQLTDAPHGAAQPTWGPGGQRLLFAASIPRADLERRLSRTASLERPGRTPADTLFAAVPDTLVVLRDTTTLNPLDTVSVAMDDSLLIQLADSLGAYRDTVAGPMPSVPRADADGTLLQVRKFLASNARADNPSVTTRLDLQGERGLRPQPSYRHYFVVTVPENVLRGDPPRPMPRRVTTGFRTFADAVWHPNGQQLILSGSPPVDSLIDRVRERHLYLAELNRTSIRRLLRINHHALSDPTVTQDGTTIAFRMRDLRNRGYAQSEIGLFNLDGRSLPLVITDGFDRDVAAPQWSPDGWYLYTTAASEGAFPLYRFAPFDRSDTTSARGFVAIPEDAASRDSFAVDTSMVQDVRAERLTAAGRGVRAYDATDASVAYAITEASNPYELYANTVRFSRERRLSTLNTGWLSERVLAVPERFRVTRDSVRIDGWTMRPPGLPDTMRAPLVMQMHGGPSAMWGPGEATMWHEFQYLAGRGFAVAYCNPRGSGGYGQDFKAMNYKNWGPGPAADVLAAADSVAALDWVDASRQILTGGSYAGYLTAWMASQHPDRFDAAIAQRGVYHLPAFFGEGNAWRLVPGHFGGYPWEGQPLRPAGVLDTTAAPAPTVRDSSLLGNPTAVDTAMTPRDALLRNSPLTFVDSIRTPMLILHASEDLRTGVSQSEWLYKSLKVLGRPVEYVRYPDAGHDLSRTGDPHQRVDRLLRIYEFAARYAQDAAFVPRPNVEAP